MFLLLELGIYTEYLLKMRLLSEVYAPGEAVEGMHALVYPLMDVPVAGTRNPNGKLTEDAPSDGSRRCRGGSGRDARPCVSAVHVLVAGTRNPYGILTEDAPSGGSRHHRGGSGRDRMPLCIRWCMFLLLEL
jgi:hypothetical protein